jgi:hypothetical protein
MKGQIPKVALIVPSGDTVHAQFTECLMQMMLVSAPKVMLGYFNIRCSHIDKSRNEAVKMVMDHNKSYPEKPFTHVCFVDSDQTFPPETLLQLLSHKRAVASVASVRRVEPVDWTCRDKKGDRVPVHERQGLIRVHTNGFSFMLLEMRVFDGEGSVAAFPWFKSGYTWNNSEAETNQFIEGARFCSEDEWFCLGLKERGYAVMVDADLSVKIGHIGTRQFTVSDIE